MSSSLKILIRRRHQPGSNLMMLIAVAVVIVGFLGISVYTGLQAFVESDLQRICMNAAMAGASQYYSSSANQVPTPNVPGATATAKQTFDALIASSSVGGFGTTLVSVTANDSNDSITVKGQSSFGTAFLAPIGIQQIDINTSSTARALKYEPTAFTGPVIIIPDGVTASTYTKTLKLAFPLVDGPGNDLYVEQDPTNQQGYIVEACNDTMCYDLSGGATSVGTGQRNGNIIIGTAMIDIGQAGVHKATQIRFTHSNDFTFIYDHGVGYPYLNNPQDLTITRVMLFGYAGACADNLSCGIPAGFSPVFE